MVAYFFKSWVSYPQAPNRRQNVIDAHMKRIPVGLLIYTKTQIMLAKMLKFLVKLNISFRQ